jgi:hypothetical protein
MVEAAVRHACVVGIAEQIIHPVHAEGVADNDLRQNRFPIGKGTITILDRPNSDLGDVFGL